MAGSVLIVVLTPYYQSLLPVDLRLGKMLVLGSLFQCLDPILTVAACLSSKPLFSSPMEKRDEAAKYETTKAHSSSVADVRNRARAQFLSANSDLLTDARAYDQCMKVLRGGKAQALRNFCEEASPCAAPSSVLLTTASRTSSRMRLCGT